MELEEPKGSFSTPRNPLGNRGKPECSWVLRVSPSSMAKFTVEYLSLPGSHMSQVSVLTICEEGHREGRMSGNPSWRLNFGLELSSVEALLGLGNNTTKMVIHIVGMAFFLNTPSMFKIYKTGILQVECVCILLFV